MTIARSAVLSECGLYRYQLRREWDASLPCLCVAMLNPSTADAYVDDATIGKLYGFCRQLGYGSFVVVNLYAFRATKPRDLWLAADPVGPLNDAAILDAVLASAGVLCAWGGNAAGKPREQEVRDMLHLFGIECHQLRGNADGTPAHPLYLPYSCALETYVP